MTRLGGRLDTPAGHYADYHAGPSNGEFLSHERDTYHSRQTFRRPELLGFQAPSLIIPTPAGIALKLLVTAHVDQERLLRLKRPGVSPHGGKGKMPRIEPHDLLDGPRETVDEKMVRAGQGSNRFPLRLSLRADDPFVLVVQVPEQYSFPPVRLSDETSAVIAALLKALRIDIGAGV